MKTLRFILIAILMTGAATLYAQETEWKADKAHSKIKFVAIHMGITEVEGQFNEYTVAVSTNREDFTNAYVEVNIQAQSIESGNSKRDDHLRSDSFLDVNKFPEIQFSGQLVKNSSDEHYKLKGDLTIKDVTRPVELDVDYKGTVDAMGAVRAGFKITGTIDRFDYHVDWNKTFTKGFVVGRDIEIVCDVELNKVNPGDA